MNITGTCVRTWRRMFVIGCKCRIQRKPKQNYAAPASYLALANSPTFKKYMDQVVETDPKWREKWHANVDTDPLNDKVRPENNLGKGGRGLPSKTRSQVRRKTSRKYFN